NIMPAVREINLADHAEMGVAVEGSTRWWPAASEPAVLPELDPWDHEPHYIEVFNRGRQPFDFTVETVAPWLQVTPEKGNVTHRERVLVTVDWAQVPAGRQPVPGTVSGPGDRRVVVQAPVFKPEISAVRG